MKFAALVPVFAAALAGLALAAPDAALPVDIGVSSSQDQPVFRAGVRTVPVYSTVLDANGRLVPDLEQGDFSVLDNGKPADIALFSSEPQPFTAVVMLDTSASMTANLKLLNRAAEQFLLRLLPVDRAQVGAFNDKIQMSGEFTNNRDELIADLNDLYFGNPTRLNDAIGASLDALKGMEGRRVVLVFTDGEDTSSRTKFSTVLARARDEEVMVYSIGLESEYFNGVRVVRSRPSRDLRKISEETGGGYFELSQTADLAPTFSRVATELRSQYLIAFTPTTLDGKVHKLEVRVNRPGMTVRARKSYLAASEKS
jgi:Ca-activated chloride channel homolog